MKKFLNFGSSSLMGGAIIIGVTTVLSNLIGLIRDKLLANFFGPGVVLDSYFASFRIPDFIFSSLVLGVLGAALIPALTSTNDKEKHDQIVGNVLFVITASLTALTIVAWIFAPSIVRAITSGFSSDRMALTISMTRVMLFSVVIFGASNVLGCVLQAKKIFSSVALASIFYNLGIIVGAFVAFKFDPKYLAWGVVFGAGLHLLTQLPSISKLEINWRSFAKFSAESISVFKLMLPRIAGLISGQLGLTIVTAVISMMPLGSIAVYSLAANIQSVPYSVIGVALAVAAFPFVSEAASRGKQAAQDQLNNLMRMQILLLVPVTFTLWVWRYDLVRILFGGGNFKNNAINLTAEILAILLFSVIPMSLQQLSARTMYALKNTFTPALISIGSLVMIGISSWFLKGYGLLAVCLGLTTIDCINAILMYKAANRGNATNFYKNWTYKVLVASILAIAPQFMLNSWLTNSHHNSIFMAFVMIGVSAVVSLIVYGLALWALQVEELNKLLNNLALKLVQRRNINKSSLV